MPQCKVVLLHHSELLYPYYMYGEFDVLDAH